MPLNIRTFWDELSETVTSGMDAFHVTGGANVERVA